MKLSPKAVGLALGIISGLSLLILTLLALYANYLTHIAELLIGVYPYYEISLQGSIAALIWGFVDGLICGVLFAWIYNLIAPGSAE
jgi:hypothetical protein